MQYLYDGWRTIVVAAIACAKHPNLEEYMRATGTLILITALATSLLAEQNTYDGGVLVDNGDQEYTEGGTWINAEGDYYHRGVNWSGGRKTTISKSWAQWKPTLPATDTYRVYLWHTHSGAWGNVTIEIKHASGTQTIKRNTGHGPSGWQNLGDYPFAQGNAGYVKITLDSAANSGLNLYADGAKWLPVSKIDTSKFPPYPRPDGSYPTIDKKGGGNILISGQPRLLLYGETLEDGVSEVEDVPYYNDLFNEWQWQGLNTLGAILEWRSYEQVKDFYRYAMIDALIDCAKARNMHLIIVWFGSWRNLSSGYIPGYIAGQPSTYLQTKTASGSNTGKISPFANACAVRDGQALYNLLERAKTRDPNHQVLVGIQVQNEMPSDEDFSAQATAHLSEQVPQNLLTYLKSMDTPTYNAAAGLGQWTWNAYHGNGSKTSGTWNDVFGAANGRKAMCIYYMGVYSDTVINIMRRSWNIPTYCNTWCDQSPCDHNYMDIFHAGVPGMDGMGPDLLGSCSNYSYVYKWKRSWNSLVIPEACNIESRFTAIADGALLSGLYADAEQMGCRGGPTGKVIINMMPAICAHRYNGNMLAFNAGGQQNYQNLAVNATVTVSGRGGVSEITGPGVGANGCILKMGPDEYCITSTKTDVSLQYAAGGAIGVAWAEQGQFSNGTWVKRQNATVVNNGTSLQFSFPTTNGVYGQVRFKLKSQTALAAGFTMAPISGTAPLSVAFNGSSSAAGTGSIASYAWDFGDSQTATGSTVTHVYQAPGTYTVRLTVKDVSGNTDWREEYIDVGQLPVKVRFLNSRFSVAVPNSQACKLTIFDARGRIIRRADMQPSGVMDIQSLPKGLYIAKVTGNTKASLSKIMIAH